MTRPRLWYAAVFTSPSLGTLDGYLRGCCPSRVGLELLASRNPDDCNSSGR